MVSLVSKHLDYHANLVNYQLTFQRVLLLLLSLISVALPINILGKLASLKDKLVSKVLGDDNCGCPCREYQVAKCDVEWVDHCYQEGYSSKCEKRQIFVPRMVRLKNILFVD